MKANRFLVPRALARTALPALAGLMTIVMTPVDSAHAVNTTTMVASLRGGQEVPPVPTNARGCARFEIDTNAKTMRFHIAFGGLTGAEVGAHIHGVAGPGANAGVLFALPPGNPKVGVWAYPAALEPDLLAGRMYVNIHSNGFPGGEIRGQIVDFVADLDGPQETPPVAVASQGWGLFNIDTCANTLQYHIVIESLSAAETAAHIHGRALHGINAGVVHALPAGPVKVGVWNYPESLEQGILDGQMYVNVHTGPFPGGEIRGQVVRTVVPIDASQEVPPTPIAAAYGCAFCSFDQPGTTMGYYMGYAGLTGPETASHIHGFAPPGANAGVLLGLPAGTPKKGMWAYGAVNQPGLFGDLTYINIHTAAFPGGEIRGQIVVPLNKCPGDVNCDGTTGVPDLLVVINGWGPCAPAPAPCPGDADYNGTVGVPDLLLVINGWGKCP